MPSSAYDHNVFINCPFDEPYRPMLYALVFAVHDCGFKARSTLEIDDSDVALIDPSRRRGNPKVAEALRGAGFSTGRRIIGRGAVVACRKPLLGRGAKETDEYAPAQGHCEGRGRHAR